MTTPTTTYLHQPMPCPLCGDDLNAATDFTGTAVNGPKPGALCVCVGCAGLLFFGLDMALYAMTPLDLEELRSREPDVYAKLLRTQDSTRRAQAKRRGEGTSSEE